VKLLKFLPLSLVPFLFLPLAPASTPATATRSANTLTLMPRALAKFKVNFSAVSLSAATAKTTVGVKAPANQNLDIVAARVSFNGTDSTKVPVLVEWCSITFATNSPGTNSTSVTPVQISGPTTTVQSTAAKAWSTEPTVISVMDTSYITPAGGVFELLVPTSIQTVVAGGAGFGIRLTAPDAVSASGYVAFVE